MLRIFLVGAAVLLLAPADAAELKVLTTGAVKPVLSELVAPFEAESGHTVRLVNDTAGGLARRIAAGEAFDVVVLTPGPLTELAQAGRVAAAVPLAKVGIGVAVKEGAPLPNISSAEALRQTLLAARAVAMVDPAAGGSSGIYLARLFERWGIAEALRPKLVLVPGGLAAARLVDGSADIALQQVSELLLVKGVNVVGMLPAEVQNYTVYAGAVSTTTREGAAAKAFLGMVSGPRAAPILVAKGMQAAE